MRRFALALLFFASFFVALVSWSLRGPGAFSSDVVRVVSLLSRATGPPACKYNKYELISMLYNGIKREQCIEEKPVLPIEVNFN